MKALTPTMQEAADFAKANGGELARLPGGFWVRPGADHKWDSRRYFGTPTVQALVSRGVASYTEWQEGRNGRFPVRMTLIAVERSEVTR